MAISTDHPDCILHWGAEMGGVPFAGDAHGFTSGS